MFPKISAEELRYQQLHFHDNRTPAVIAGCIILISTATLTVGLRLASRRMGGMQWKADDYTIVAALVTHVQSLYLPTLMSLYAFEAIFPACTGTTKFSILLLYRRIFTVHRRRFEIALYVVGGLIIGWGVSGFFTTVFQCTPVNYLWVQEQGSCINVEASLVALASINTTLNIAVLILPMPMVWRLHMPTKQKIAVCGVFVLGSLDIVSSIVRTYLMSHVTFSLNDLTWHDTSPAMLAFTEPCIGIICACLPAMWSLVRNATNSGSPGHRSKASIETHASLNWARRHRVLAKDPPSTAPSSAASDTTIALAKQPSHDQVQARVAGREWLALRPTHNAASVTNDISRGDGPADDVDANGHMRGIEVTSDVEWSAASAPTASRI
ncbi:MAG: hypothetical protein M1832_004179 [Thelocarpon impressellum]|nr:MAG: hypothetical protein M1832_004179 [Thelocarpon impressellum]